MKVLNRMFVILSLMTRKVFGSYLRIRKEELFKSIISYLFIIYSNYFSYMQNNYLFKLFLHLLATKQ